MTALPDTSLPLFTCRCHYCQGTGYLLCGNCSGAGTTPVKGMELATAGAAGAGAPVTSNGFNGVNGSDGANGYKSFNILNGSNGFRASSNTCCCGVCSGMGKVM